MEAEKMKKILVLMLGLVVLIVSGCSGGEGDNSKSGETDKASGGGEAEFTIKLGHAGNGLESDPYYSYTTRFEEVLAEESNGRIKLEVFPNSQLGDLTSMMQQVDEGTLDMSAGQNSGTLASYDKNIQVLDIPYAFESLDVGRKVLDGEFGDKIISGVMESSNLKIMSFIPSAFRHFGTNKVPVKTPDDLKGLTIRVMEIPIHQKMVESLGATPIVIPFEETYSAVQSGVVDGHEQAPYTMLMANLEEVTDYFNLDKHTMNTAVTIINSDFFNGLSEEDQRIVAHAESEALQALLNHIDEGTEGDMEQIKAAGVEIIEIPPENFVLFQEKVIDNVIEYLEKEIGDREMIDLMFEAIEKEGE